jgi:cysteine-rich repeat protein
MMAAYRFPRAATACAVVALVMATTRPSHAHGLPALPLALWGPFGAPTVDCLRHLSQATRRCFNAALTAQRRCVDARLEGHVCDEAARDATIAAARATAAATVDAACRGGQLTELRFANATDARNDLLLACSEADTTLRMVYAPALNRVIAPGLSRSDRHCIAHVGAAASKLVMARVHDHSRVFDAAAVYILTPSQKLGRFATANQRLAAAQARMATRLADACDGATVYDGDPGRLLALLERRSACVLSSVYFHTSVTCPLAVCGDGIVDSGEACDDGNGVDSDGCRADCTAL